MFKHFDNFSPSNYTSIPQCLQHFNFLETQCNSYGLLGPLYPIIIMIVTEMKALKKAIGATTTTTTTTTTTKQQQQQGNCQ